MSTWLDQRDRRESNVLPGGAVTMSFFYHLLHFLYQHAAQAPPAEYSPRKGSFRNLRTIITLETRYPSEMATPRNVLLMLSTDQRHDPIIEIDWHPAVPQWESQPQWPRVFLVA
jgi:hypothetical protein